MLTWCHVTKTNGGHRHKAEVEGVKESPVLEKIQASNMFNYFKGTVSKYFCVKF
jgi:hypothetical protein